MMLYNSISQSKKKEDTNPAYRHSWLLHAKVDGPSFTEKKMEQMIESTALMHLVVMLWLETGTNLKRSPLGPLREGPYKLITQFQMQPLALSVAVLHTHQKTCQPTPNHPAHSSIRGRAAVSISYYLPVRRVKFHLFLSIKMSLLSLCPKSCMPIWPGGLQFLPAALPTSKVTKPRRVEEC